MFIRIMTIVVAVIFGGNAVALATEFPTGSLEGVGFLVEKGSMKFTEKDLYVHRASANIVKLSDDTYEITTSVVLQKNPSTRQKTDKRVDVFNVIWETNNSGKLINKSKRYSKDKSTFTVTKDKLIIKSWIERNQL